MYQEEKNKLLCDKAFETANTSRHDGYKHGLAVLFHECFDKKAGDTSTYIGTKIISDGQTLVNEWHKIITRKCQRRKVYESYQHETNFADFVDMLLISKYN